MIGLVRSLVEWSLVPFDALPAFVGLTLVSAITGVGALLVVGWTTNQGAVQRARDQMSATILEMRLWLDSPRRVFAAQGRMLAWTLRYVGATLPALVILLPPLTLAALNLDLRHAWAPVEVGGEALLRVEGGTKDLVVEGPLKASAPVFVHPSEGAAYVRLAAAEPGRHEVVLKQGEATATKVVVVGEDAGPVSMERVSGLAALWAFGVEAPLSGSGPFTRIALEHPTSTDTFLWMPWWGFWLVVSVVVALALRKPLGVAI